MSDLQTNKKKLPDTIVKRSGKEVSFDKVKVRTAIYNALRATDDVEQGKDINEVTEKLLRAVLRDIKAREDGKLHVEDVQDLIENRLMDFGFNNTARYFIKYRFLHKLNRDKADGTTLIDCNQTIDEYVGFFDWRIKANSNSSYSHASLINNSAGKIIANYWLDKVYSKEVGKAHRNGDIYLHDLDILGPYCFHGDTKIITKEFGEISFKDLVAKGVSEVTVRSIDADGASVWCSALHPRITREDTDLIELEFEDGSKVKCTPDHKFMLTDGTWNEANNLLSTDNVKTDRGVSISVVKKTKLEGKFEAYDITVPGTHNFALSNGAVVHNCCGHDLQQVLNEGFNGVRGRVNSRPPKHFREALGQMANYLGILQSEWAGAQAFSSFDTLLAPYVFRDKLSYKEVKKAILSFVYNLNVPSRWGQCIPDTYKCLASDGRWKGPDELEQGEFIHTVDLIDGCAEYAQVQAIHKYPAPKVLHEYYGKRLNFRVTPGHRVLYRTQNAHREGKLTESEILLAEGEQVCVPTAYWAPSNGVFRNCIAPPVDDPDLLYTLVAMIYRDGRITPGGSLKFYNTKGAGDKLFKETAEALGVDYSFDGSSYIIRDDTFGNIEIINLVINFLHNVQPYYFDVHKAWLVLRVFHLLDGSPKITNDLKNVYYAADEKMLNAIATLGVITGWSVEVDKKNMRVLMGQGGAVEKVKVREVKNEDVEYVWCPTTEHGTFVCMNDEGQVFLTGNCPFTNITLDWTVPNLLKENFPTCGDMHIFSDIESDPELEKEAERRGTDLHLMTYKDFVPEMKMIQRAYFEVMTEGDSTGQPFTFPIPTVNITEEFDWDDENCKYLFDNAAKIGSPYFQNFIGSQYKRNPETGELDERDPNAYNPDDLRSMCCRLQLNKAEIRESIKKRGGGLFGSDSKTGSIGNVTINLARLGYLYKGDEHGLLNRLDELMDLAKESLEAKRKFILEMMERGLYPYTSRYIHSLDTFFSTIGINGANEMIRNFTNDKHNIVDDYGQAMAIRLLTHIRERMEMYKTTTGNLWNLEASPGEACFPRFSEVLTANGPVKIEDLVNTEEEILLPSYNVETRKLEYKKMVKAYQSGIAEELVDIVFTNGQTVTCTPNHPIAVRVSNYRSKEDIMWVPAENLIPGDRVKSNYIRTRGAGHYYSSLDKGVSIHRRIWEFYNGSIPEGYVIHHKDFDKHNNVISNLDMISDAEHRALHLKKAQSEGKNLVHCGEENPFYGKKHKLSTKKVIADAKALYDKEQLDKFIDAYVNGRMSFAQIGRLYGFNRIAVKQCIRTRQKWGVIKVDNPVCAYAQFNETTVKYLYDIGKSLEETLYIFGGSADTKALVTYTYNKLKFESEDNHTVERVVRYKTNEPVYNLEVEDNHNYFVGGMSSILVHNCCHKFAREDAKRFPDIIQAGTPKNNYYTNSTQLPVSYTNDPFVALEKQDDLQCLYSGGTVIHMYMGEAMTSGDACKSFVKKILTNFRLPYISITPTFSVCPTHGYISGKHTYCPYCDEEIIKEEKQKNCCDHG